ncbi:hypothetical protein [Megalodesulfovibrio gigas]|uniref:Uncharacterized protein n=1 Tax=Megalodesulfovibrio gigas (strain ATCC 19364 / DSM 1382 / NCIMB 9332 / VKM B-1759) TaxID=1121448 RepID=T2GFE2_MEGG1|nr:hypothetical protein [Megalodesulfovibrio gigas]AGW14612.1 hypothetical protein DGI_2885 [Megalodesulfovibrio gigas DSM 1382 = ATCC 19364]
MKLPTKLACAVAALVCLWAAMAFAAQDTTCDMPLITGEHWSNATAQEKLAFLAGMATVIELEQEVQGDTPGECKTLIHSWIKGIGDQRLVDMRAKLDQWYAANPDKRADSVVEVLWHQFVAPKLGAKQ